MSNVEFKMPLDTIKELENSYNLPERKYHNLNHINRMLSDYESFKDCQSGFEYMLLYGVPYMNGKMDRYSNDQYMYWIIWFHDFVYQGLPTDEILSAHAASFRFFKTFHIPYSLELDMNIVFPIYSTQHRGIAFEPLEDHKYGFAKLLCDLDLLGLSDSWEDYMKRSEDVLAEAYLLHKGMYSKFELIRKRAVWLNSFLQRKCISNTTFSISE